MLAKGAGNTPVILDCQPDGRDNSATASDIAQHAWALTPHYRATGQASTGAICAETFNMDGLVVGVRHANVNGQYLSPTNV
jgi:hypothetical protein